MLSANHGCQPEVGTAARAMVVGETIPIPGCECDSLGHQTKSARGAKAVERARLGRLKQHLNPETQVGQIEADFTGTIYYD